ncbi:MAG: hypothetical protein A2341_22830 [Deltaproteobacteria bacterium RIFOXYB12_FULL_58_9]|nr:MAG: hypothetical protein A2341_22830 [Deltaproteobacteria bacterium RIFOXYB12_FULL_58_9]
MEQTSGNIFFEQKVPVVIGLGEDRKAILGEETIDNLLMVLCQRAHRLVDDPSTCERLRPAFGKFLHNVVEHFNNSGELDDYTLTNIMTALVTADNRGPAKHGMEDYSTLIRCLNPTDPDAGKYFIIGREGSINDPECPLNEMQNNGVGLERVPAAQLHMFYAFYYARAMDVSRGAPKILVDDFFALIPEEILDDPTLEEALLDVCFSDGAWELYQMRRN